LKFLVIGGGISGLFLSYYLLEAGNEVVVVEAPKGPVRTSAYNAGQLSTRPSFTDVFAPSEIVRISARERRLDRKWFALARRQGRDEYEQVASALAERSLSLYSKFFAKERAKVDLAGEVLELHSKLPSQNDPEPGARFMGPRELQEVGYKGFEGGWRMEEKSLHSGKLLDLLGSRISEMGGEVVEGEAHLKQSDSSIVRAVVNGESVAADAYVVAAGSWSREVCRPLRYDPMVIPARGLVLFYRTGGERVVDFPAHYDDEGVTATQHGADTMRFTSFFELVGFNPRFSASRRDWLFRTVTSHFSRKCRLQASEVGVGYRPSTPDQLPVVGRIPRCENGYILTGSTRKGMALAPVLGQLLTNLMLGSANKDGRENHLLRAMDPARFAKGQAAVPKF
jgi:glycine/D-amino acid oxidase-like deaminating enzyme